MSISLPHRGAAVDRSGFPKASRLLPIASCFEPAQPRLIAVLDGPLMVISETFALIGDLLPAVCDPLALVGEPLALIREPLALIRDSLTLVREPLPLIRYLLALIRHPRGHVCWLTTTPTLVA
jgi:hypothetical protein